MGVKIDLSGVRPKLNSIQNNTKVGLFTSETFARYADQFVPMDTGMLAQNYTTQPFKIIYNSPYAHYQYTGDNFNFQRDMHPNATAHWDQATWETNGTQIRREITQFLKLL